MSNKFYRAALLTLGLGALCACSDKGGPAPKPEPESVDLLVCTFNIRYPEPSDGDYIWDKRKEAVCNFILLKKPDLIAMQEVEPVQAKYILDKVKSEYGLYGIGRDTGTDILMSTSSETSKTILYKKSRFSVLDKGTFWHSDDNPYQVMKKNGSNDFGTFHLTHRNITSWMKLSDLKHPGHTIWFFDTHYQNNNKCTDPDGKRELETGLHLSLMPQIMSAPLGESCSDPVFLVGDFNTTSSSAALKTLRNIPMGYAREDAVQSDHRSTITDNGFGKPGNLIDHMFYCGPLKCLSYTVDKRNYGILYISDHYPVLSEFHYTK